MEITIKPGNINGTVTILPSKSHLHRLLIIAALADRETFIRAGHTEAEDVEATIACLHALGAEVARQRDGFAVTPLRACAKDGRVILPCRESGSTLRFLVPVVCTLGVTGDFQMAGRLPERPMEFLEAELSRHGITFSRPAPDILRCEGKLTPGSYAVPGNISSQYITGLMLALPLLGGDSVLTVSEPVESENYIDMTIDAAAVFGRKPEVLGGYQYKIRGVGGFAGPGEVMAEGDWSNAAFWLCAGAMPGGNVTCRGLNPNSLQGDKEVCGILERMGAKISWNGDAVTVTEGVRRGVEIDAAAIPDIIPVISAVAAVSDGTTLIRNASRLRLKESDRLKSTASVLNSLGAKVSELPDGLRIDGVPCLSGGTADSWGDHRIAMMAAIASSACRSPVTITGAEAVNKSYPDFFDRLADLGKPAKEARG